MWVYTVVTWFYFHTLFPHGVCVNLVNVEMGGKKPKPDLIGLLYLTPNNWPIRAQVPNKHFLSTVCHIYQEFSPKISFMAPQTSFLEGRWEKAWEKIIESLKIFISTALTESQSELFYQLIEQFGWKPKDVALLALFPSSSTLCLQELLGCPASLSSESWALVSPAHLLL